MLARDYDGCLTGVEAELSSGRRIAWGIGVFFTRQVDCSDMEIYRGRLNVRAIMGPIGRVEALEDIRISD